MGISQSDQGRKARNAYAKKWRANNPEKVKAAQNRYWERRAEREAAAQAAETGKEEATNG